jgi:hypothetical protein
VGFFCNAAVRPVPESKFEDLGTESTFGPVQIGRPPSPGSWVLVAGAWTLVGVPLLWGTWRTLRLAAQLFA